MTNPYASFLGDKDALAVLGETPGSLRRLVDQLGQQGLERSLAPGKWSAKQIICHLADCEINYGFRIRQTFSQENYVIQQFDQDEWAEPYGAYSAQHALEVFTALRGWNLAFMKFLTPEDLARSVTHPKHGPLTLQILLDWAAGHDINHLQQLDTLAKEA
jgi:DinB superfamily